jgi:hypothetical protein
LTTPETGEAGPPVPQPNSITTAAPPLANAYPLTLKVADTNDIARLTATVDRLGEETRQTIEGLAAEAVTERLERDRVQTLEPEFEFEADRAVSLQ